MTEQLETELRRLFAEDAEHAPVAVALAEEARRRARRHRQTRVAWGTGILVAASVAGAALGGGVLTNQPAGDRTTAPSASNVESILPGSRPTGAVPDGGSTSCAMRPTPSNVARAAFAFDGTVTSVGSEQSDGLVATTFAVNEWFIGGPGASVTVLMPPPDDRPSMGEAPPTYEVGTRLLVSGAHLQGGTTMDDAIAWGCGFTRYYEGATADGWRAATR